MTERISRVPTLAEVLETPALIAELPAPVAAALVVQLAAVQAQLGARLAVVDSPGDTRGPVPDELLDTASAARRLGVSSSTLAHGVDRMPYSALVAFTGSRRRRFSAQRIAEFVRGEATAPGSRRISRRGGAR